MASWEVFLWFQTLVKLHLWGFSRLRPLSIRGFFVPQKPKVWRRKELFVQNLVLPPKTNMEPQKWSFGRWFSSSNRWFSGSMLVFGGVCYVTITCGIFLHLQIWQVDLLALYKPPVNKRCTNIMVIRFSDDKKPCPPPQKKTSWRKLIMILQ